MSLHDWIYFMAGAVIGSGAVIGFMLGAEMRRMWHLKK